MSNFTYFSSVMHVISSHLYYFYNFTPILSFPMEYYLPIAFYEFAHLTGTHLKIPEFRRAVN